MTMTFSVSEISMGMIFVGFMVYMTLLFIVERRRENRRDREEERDANLNRG